jgi:POT family proton-dependent oligopeptide transporter
MISPIGLAVTTQLAPQAFRAQMIALYFFSVGLGTSLSGVLANYYDPAREFAYFGILGVVAIAAGLVVFGLSGYISRLMEACTRNGIRALANRKRCTSRTAKRT